MSDLDQNAIYRKYQINLWRLTESFYVLAIFVDKFGIISWIIYDKVNSLFGN